MSTLPTPLLSFRLNACPTCMTCLVCTKIYGKDCSCQSIELHWKRKRSSEYKLDFLYKHITQRGANKKRVKYDREFVNWFEKNVTQIETRGQDFINICRRCLNNYNKVQSKVLYIYNIIFILKKLYLTFYLLL
jgi:hypothetical protein